MKQKFLLLTMLVVVFSSFTTNILAQNKTSVIKNDSNFTTYKFEEIEFTLPNSFVEQTKENRKIVNQYFRVSSFTIEEYVKLPGYLLNRKIFKMIENGETVTKQTFINYFEQNEKFILLDYSPMSVFVDSYNLENKNDMYIESALYNSADGMLLSEYLSYSFEILKGEKIFSISIVSEIKDDFVNQYPEYFDVESSNKKWKFIDRKNNGWISFYNDFISENTKFPMYMRDLKIAYEIFIKTVK